MRRRSSVRRYAGGVVVHREVLRGAIRSFYGCPPRARARRDRGYSLPMRGRTHELVGVGLAIVTARAIDLPAGSTVGVAAAALVGSRLPDLDKAGARIYHKTLFERRMVVFRVVGSLARLPLSLGTRLRHRGVTHSALACAAAPLLAWLLTSAAGPGVAAVAAAGIGIGYVAHVAADACTPGGVRAWAPLSRERVWLLPPRARIKTGSARELVFAVVFAALATVCVALMG